jgi:hypothetical protein
MGRALGRHQRITAGKYATYNTSADADVCIDRNTSSTLQTIKTLLVYITMFVKTQLLYRRQYTVTEAKINGSRTVNMM